MLSIYFKPIQPSALFCGGKVWPMWVFPVSWVHPVALSCSWELPKCSPIIRYAGLASSSFSAFYMIGQYRWCNMVIGGQGLWRSRTMLSSVENDGQSDIQHFLGKYTIEFQMRVIMLNALTGSKKNIKFSSEIVANWVPKVKVPLRLAKRTIPFLAYLTLSVVCGATLHCLLWGPLTPFTPAQYLLLCPRKTLRPRFVAAVLQEYLNCCLFCIFSMWAYLTAELDSDSSNTCKVLWLLTVRKLLLWSTRVSQRIRWTAHKIDQLLLLMYTIVTNALLTSNDGNYYFDRGPPGVFILRKGVMQICCWTFWSLLII